MTALTQRATDTTTIDGTPPETYIDGTPVCEGDYISTPCYPKGTLRGIIRIRDQKIGFGNKWYSKNFYIESEDGITYGTTGKMRKLKRAPR